MNEHPNATLLRGLLEAFATGDVAGEKSAFAEDIVARVGDQPVQRTVRGPRGGDPTPRRDAGGRHPLPLRHPRRGANDEHAIALVHQHLAVADGRRYDQQQVQVAHVRDGKIVELWTMNQDQAVLDLLIER